MSAEAARSAAPAVAGPRPIDALAAGLLVACCALWGLNQVAIKVANDGIPAVFQAGLRAGGAALLVTLWCRWRAIPLFERDGTLWPGLAAGLLFGVEFIAVYVGLDHTTASRSAVFLYTMPFFVALGAHVFLPGERLTRTRVIGMALAFAGLLLAFSRALDPAPGAVSTLFGDAMLVFAAALWAATTLVIKRTALARARPEKTLLYQLAVAAVVSVALAAMTGKAQVGDATPLVWASLAFQTVIVASMSYLTWFWLMVRYPAGDLTAFTFLTPLFGVFFGYVLMGDPLGSRFLAGLALVAAGIYLVNRPRKRQ